MSVAQFFMCMVLNCGGGHRVNLHVAKTVVNPVAMLFWRFQNPQ